jgi:hypothetical protein
MFKPKNLPPEIRPPAIQNPPFQWSAYMNAQDLMTTSVVGLATDSRIRHDPSHRNLSSIESHPIAPPTLADTIGPDRPLRLDRSSVRPSIGVQSAGRARKDAKSSIQHAMLAAIFLAAGTSSAAFGDETSAGVTVLRGTPARVEQPQKPQPAQVALPPLPSCAEGYAYSLLGGYCYKLRYPGYTSN